jgi:acetoin utilization deacetylase AcuC-like enzyme
MPRPPRVLLLSDRAMLRHAAPGHPERPERLAAAIEGVELGADASAAELLRRAPAAASDETISLVHDGRYLASLDEAAAGGGGWLDADTYLGPESMRAARLAAGATVDASLAAARGEAEVAFAVVRPPGHHASTERASGFCLLNNIAIAVAALRADDLAERVAIVDWDVHHGDGTQAIFAADAALCYASTHQSPLYPGTGGRAERGVGAAAGTKHNAPLLPGTGDAEFVAAWRDELLPAIEAFGPQAILVSAGYDAAAADPLAELEISRDGYRAVATLLGELVGRLGLPGVALTLEGGYDLPSLTADIAATVEGLVDGMGRPEEPRLYSTPPR